MLTVDQWFDAEAVAHHRQLLFRIVPEGKRKHATQLGQQAVDAPLLIAAQNHFGISMGAETMAERFQLRTDLAEVVDAAVEDQPDLPVIGEHGLIAGGAQIDD